MMGVEKKKRDDHAQCFIRILCRILYSHVDHRQSEDEAGNKQNPCRDEHIHKSTSSHMRHCQPTICTIGLEGHLDSRKLDRVAAPYARGTC